LLQKKIGWFCQSAHFFAPFKKHSARPWHDLIFASPVFLFFFFDEKALRPTLARLSKYGSPTRNRLTYGRTRLLPTVLVTFISYGVYSEYFPAKTFHSHSDGGAFKGATKTAKIKLNSGLFWGGALRRHLKFCLLNFQA
jgi:hypothetical protein